MSPKTMDNPTQERSTSLQQSVRRAALRRNIRTAAIVAIAFSGGPFGLTALATSSATVFGILLLWQFKQHQAIQ
jgi:hypothetical protein